MSQTLNIVLTAFSPFCSQIKQLAPFFSKTAQNHAIAKTTKIVVKLIGKLIFGLKHALIENIYATNLINLVHHGFLRQGIDQNKTKTLDIVYKCE